MGEQKLDLSFEQRVMDWERRIEDVLLEMMQQRSKEGLAICQNSMPVVAEFSRMVRELRAGYYSDRAWLRPTVPEGAMPTGFTGIDIAKPE